MVAGFVNAGDYSDDVSGLNQAAQDAASSGLDLWIPKRGAVETTLSSTFTVPAGVSVEQFTRMRYTGSNTQPAIVWGSAGTANQRSTWRGLDVGRSASWSNNFEGVGVRLFNPQFCLAVILSANGFDHGVQLIGDGADAIGSRIECASVTGTRVAFRLRSRNGGRVMHNRIVGGRQSSANLNSSWPRYHYVTESDGSGGSSAENDLFNCLMASNSEYDARDTSGECASFYLKTPYNVVWGVRCEAFENDAGDDYVIVDGSAAHHNFIWPKWDNRGLYTDNTNRNGAPSNNVIIGQRDISFTSIGGFSY